ncbi:MAG: ParA family protein [Deltaproteobacteria bacterium]|nr:ParA family protein [Deltaproteobacteria bacterium]
MITDKIREFIGVETARNLEPGGKSARTIAVCSQKGGVGKTTTAVNLGAAFSHFHEKKVLIVDLDPQGHVEKSLGSIIPDGLDYTPVSASLTSKKGNLLNSIIRTKLDFLDITPGDKALNEAEGVLAAKIGREMILSQALKTTKTHYDYIIVDCPPNLGNLTVNALCAADFVVVPCEMSVLAFEGVTDLLNTLETVNERLNKSLKVLGVLFTRVDGRNITMNQLVEENLKNYFNGNIFKTRISVNTDLNKAQLEGHSIFHFAPSSTGAANYSALAEEIAKKVRKFDA